MDYVSAHAGTSACVCVVVEQNITKPLEIQLIHPVQQEKKGTELQLVQHDTLHPVQKKVAELQLIQHDTLYKRKRKWQQFSW